MVSTDTTVLSATMFRDKPVFGRPARPTRPCQVMVQGTIRTVSPACEPASPFVAHAIPQGESRVHRELLRNTVELVTGICESVPQAIGDLRESRDARPCRRGPVRWSGG